MSRASILKDRARMLAEARAFFAERNVLEIDCGALVRSPPIDSQIDCISVDQDEGFLHTSPEYALKRFLAEGLGDCYFLGHVYRKGEIGALHNPEFTMAEWYRTPLSFDQMIEETADFLFLFFEKREIRRLSYREAFEEYAGIDYSGISLSDLHRLTPSPWPRKTCLHYLLSHRIEPRLGIGELTALTDFPPDEAALACLKMKGGELVADRFEIYSEGIELANGYRELSDPVELRSRFNEKNRERIEEGKEPYPIDEPFLNAMKTLPECCGVALGFDRAFMLRHRLSSIHPAIPFSWSGI